MARDLKALIGQMTLEEKAGMCSGQDMWHLKGVQRLGIPSIMLTDGPHGLRKQAGSGDHLGINESVEAVCFPAACASSSSFDIDLMQKMGEALGAQCQAQDVAVLLGPAVNIKRSPLGGRNFEYMSEDPYLTGQMAAGFIKGVQSKNVGVSVKHFAANNQEYMRMSVSSEADERTLREIYLAAFETIVKTARPWTVMDAYNKINGVFAGEDHRLLTRILRDEWGFDGFVVSDWGAVSDRVAGLAAGMDVEMPASGGDTDRQIVKAVQSGALEEKVLDTAVERILEILFRFADNRQAGAYDLEKDHALAVHIAEQSAVLLKNTGVLPLKKGANVAFIGEFAQKPRYQGAGSSHINPSKVVSALEAAQGIEGVGYAKGFGAEGDESNQEWLQEAAQLAGQADVAVVFAGLPSSFESEGFDREHMRLPDCQNELIAQVVKVQPNTVVVLHNGAPIEMPWVNDVAAILEMYLGGQGVGEASVNLLYGQSNPSGKLAESFPQKVEDNPSYLFFPGDGKKVEYREGVYVGYRYYDTKNMQVNFPFGHGLSYTAFNYANLRLNKTSMRDDESASVSVDITNTGAIAGKEVVQLYVRDHSGTPNRPDKELKGFVKLSLEPGQTKTATFTLDKRSFAWYNEEISDWYAKSGEYEILIGASSRDIRLGERIGVESTAKIPFVITQNTTVQQLLDDARTRPQVEMVMGGIQSSMGDTSNMLGGNMMMHVFKQLPLRALRTFLHLEQEQLDALVEGLNSMLE